MPKKIDFTIGLIGNPNVGKSTLFNSLTGAKQHVGNWPGKTVEKKEGSFLFANKKIKVIDLPGSYSLTPYTQEEAITTDFVLQEKPSVIIQIVDAQNFVRNLFMTIQLIELGAPLVLALNMVDLARTSGITININKLSEFLGIPVIPINAKKGVGTEVLIKTALKKKVSQVKLTYNTEINDELKKIRQFIQTKEKLDKNYCDWLSLRLLEGDNRTEQILVNKPYYFELQAILQKSHNHLKRVFAKDISIILTNTRYGFIKGLTKEVLTRVEEPSKLGLTEKFDNLATNKFFGLPLFLVVIWAVFQITFKLSEPLIDGMKYLFSILGQYLTNLLTGWEASKWLISLINNGVIGGVGRVLLFVPVIGILFLLIALLEDSGYMARVAYIMDRIMHRIGLHGKACIPLILGFGCNVSAIMTTRTLQTKRDRILTILITPFMSCGARLPVYVLFVGAFFTANQGWIIFSLYLLGIAVAIMMGLIFRKFLFKNLSSPFVIELPPYRWPTLRGLLIHSGEKVWWFIKKAGTVILAFSIIIWALANLPVGVEYGSKQSWAGSIGQTITPVFKPLGFANWQSSVALVFGSVAKEVVVSSFGALYGVGNVDNQAGSLALTKALQSDFTPLSAYSFMVFVLLYIPCLPTLAVIKKETNSWRWVLFVVSYTTAVAWLVAFIVYQGGKLLGLS